MPVISTTPDPSTLSLTIVTELAATPARAWEVWSDPRQLELWWGPPTWPATFVEHDLRVGARSHYFMTGPDGTQAHGWWLIRAVDAPSALGFEDGFADASGSPDDTLPTTHAHVTLEEIPTGSRMTVTSTFDSAEQMQQLLDMGMVEGLTLAVGQLDGLLARA